jgi:hypothetical protein
MGDDVSLLEGTHGCEGRVSLYADDLGLRRERRRSRGYAGDETAASHRYDDSVCIGQVLEYFKGNRPLTCDDVAVIECVDECVAGL